MNRVVFCRVTSCLMAIVTGRHISLWERACLRSGVSGTGVSIDIPPSSERRPEPARFHRGIRRFCDRCLAKYIFRGCNFWLQVGDNLALPLPQISPQMPSQEPLLLRHHRPFIAFWLARVFTASGFQMLTVAIGWNLYQLTGNVLDLGLVGLVEFAPRVLFMLHTGHVADRYDRRKVAAICQSLQALIAL